MSLHHLVYVSVAAEEMTDDYLKSLLKNARKNNDKLNVTGMLLYRDGFFMQALEGEKDTIQTLFDNVISQDKRHEKTLILCDNVVTQRRFADWKMGFNKISDEQMNMAGFISADEFFETTPSRAEEFLNLFKHGSFF
jgi:hypothetical protein